MWNPILNVRHDIEFILQKSQYSLIVFSWNNGKVLLRKIAIFFHENLMRKVGFLQYYLAWVKKGKTLEQDILFLYTIVAENEFHFQIFLCCVVNKNSYCFFCYPIFNVYSTTLVSLDTDMYILWVPIIPIWYNRVRYVTQWATIQKSAV